jgi:hypothetical protein
MKTEVVPMVTRYSRCFVRLLTPALVLVGIAGLADAADGPRRGTAAAGPVMPTESIQAPKVDASKVTRPTPTTAVARRAAPAHGDKGSWFTDASDATTRGKLNEIERAKLDMARAAVALSRSAGTLYRALPVQGMPMSREQAEAIKAEAARTRVSRGTSDPSAGLGEAPPAVQLTGPEGMSELERAKADAVSRGQAAPTPQPVSAPSRRSPSRDDGAAKNTKGGR